jgi:hypothetical protein
VRHSGGRVGGQGIGASGVRDMGVIGGGSCDRVMACRPATQGRGARRGHAAFGAGGMKVRRFVPKRRLGLRHHERANSPFRCACGAARRSEHMCAAIVLDWCCWPIVKQ